jgi:hypothetical protein
VKAGIGMSAENHVIGAICGAVVGVYGQVAEKLVHGNKGGFSGCSLLGTWGTDRGSSQRFAKFSNPFFDPKKCSDMFNSLT